MFSLYKINNDLQFVFSVSVCMKLIYLSLDRLRCHLSEPLVMRSVSPDNEIRFPRCNIKHRLQQARSDKRRGERKDRQSGRERAYRQTDRQTDTQTNRKIYKDIETDSQIERGQTGRYTHIQADRQINRQTERHTVGETGRQNDEDIDRRMNRQIDTVTDWVRVKLAERQIENRQSCPELYPNSKKYGMKENVYILALVEKSKR